LKAETSLNIYPLRDSFVCSNCERELSDKSFAQVKFNLNSLQESDGLSFLDRGLEMYLASRANRLLKRRLMSDEALIAYSQPL
jgi:hypothetical protein